jgi:hypothetical protein
MRFLLMLQRLFMWCECFFEGMSARAGEKINSIGKLRQDIRSVQYDLGFLPMTESEILRRETDRYWSRFYEAQRLPFTEEHRKDDSGNIIKFRRYGILPLITQLLSENPKIESILGEGAVGIQLGKEL